MSAKPLRGIGERREEGRGHGISRRGLSENVLLIAAFTWTEDKYKG